MHCEEQIRFVRSLLDNLHVPCHIAEEPSAGISSRIDRGLRRFLFDSEDYRSILQNSMSEAEDNTIYRFFDEFFCNYVFLRLPGEGERYLFIGPYLLELPDQRKLSERVEGLSGDEERQRKLLRYYTTLPVIEDENLLIAIATTLGQALWGADRFRVEYIDYMIPDRSRLVPVVPVEREDSPFTLELLEANYANEKLLMEAVSQGKLHVVSAMASAVYANGTEQRVPDDLRNRKNYLIILNTLLRKAAEQGGVHPLHIDRISSRYARKIERLESMADSHRLQEEMIRGYCLLVRTHSLHSYSYLVGKTITLIHFDLRADLSLKAIAAQLNVTPSYLSMLFRRECGCTLTEYVNRQRIERAVGLLARTDKQIQAVADECGIPDANYFVRLFKRQTGMTPTQYRRQNTQ